MILPNTPMVRQQMIDFVAAVNGAAVLAHGPFTLWTGGLVNDRGGWSSLSTYNTGDMVGLGGYFFVSTANGNTARPLDAVSGEPSSQWAQPWYSCYARIRDETNTAAALAVAGFAPVTPWDLSVSGRWPCQNPSVYYDKLVFYFEDTGEAESVTIANAVGHPEEALAGGSSVGMPTFAETEACLDILRAHGDRSYLPTDPSGGGSTFTSTALAGPTGDPDNTQIRYRYINSNTYSVVIGGATNATLDINFVVDVGFFDGIQIRVQPNLAGDAQETVVTHDTADPSGLITIDTTHWFPGAGFTPTFSGWTTITSRLKTGGVRFVCHVTGTVAPGKYTVTFTSTATPNNRAAGSLSTTDNGDGTFTVTGSNQWNTDTFGWIPSSMDFDGTMNIVSDTMLDTPGIDDTVGVKKIEVIDFNGLGPPIALSCQEFFSPNIRGEVDTFVFGADAVIIEIAEDATPVTPAFVFEKQMDINNDVSISASTPGYWAGKTPPVNSLGLMPFDKMPWNLFPTTLPAPGSGANTATVNRYLGVTLPYLGGVSFTNTNSTRAYANDQPAWIPDIPAAETQPCPNRWKALVHYPAGWSVLDSYGNIQTVRVAGRSGSTEPVWGHALGSTVTEGSYLNFAGTVTLPGAQWETTAILRDAPDITRSTDYKVGQQGIDDNGNVQECTVAGTTGAPTPTWATTLHGTTVDGADVRWKLVRMHAKFAPALARYTPPPYPFFWHNPVSQWVAETSVSEGDVLSDTHGNTQEAQGDGVTGLAQPTWNTTLNGTTADGTVTWKTVRLEQPPLDDTNPDPLAVPTFYPFSFRPQGWFIYRVALNRIPQKKSKEKPDAAAVSVRLGCVRAGVFVSFGTYNTGTIVDTELWPVFTNTHLAYECAERLEVQAEMLTCGLSYSMWGTVGYPMAAAHINDLMTIIGLL